MEESHRRRLILILQRAYSGELGAALAYRGHWKSVKGISEKKHIQQIEREEWIHRVRVGEMLASLGSAPIKSKEIRLWITGRMIGAACHVIGWFLPMYFAGRIESSNVEEYLTAARHARALSLAEFESDLLHMAEVERQHEKFFLEKVAGHWMLPFAAKLFNWGLPDANSLVSDKNAERGD
jgi:rubrerythrin